MKLCVFVKEGKKWVTVIAREEYASPTDTFRVDECIGFGGTVIFDEAGGGKEIGTVLSR